MDTPSLIIKSLLTKEDFSKRVFHYVRYEYFENEEDQRIVKYLKLIYDRYEKVPSILLAKTIFQERVKNISETLLNKILARLDELGKIEKIEDSLNYLLDITEEFFLKRNIYLSLVESVKIVTESEVKRYKEIPGIIDKSLNFTLKDKDIGFVYNECVDKQYAFYKERNVKYETHLKNFNKLVGGGLEKKTLNIFLGEPGIGKSRFLTDLSAHYIRNGLNVLYISLELSDHHIYQRLDANLLDININEFKNISKEYYIQKVEEIKREINGVLIIKEYPSSSIDILDIENLLDDIKRKRCIDIDVLIVDYLTVIKTVKDIGIHVGNLYVNGKIVSSELRSLATKRNLMMISALHLNRAGWANIDVKMSNVAESAGIAHGADFMAALVATDSMKKKRRILVSVLKNRLFSISDCSKTVIGFDDSRMRHFDVTDDELDTNIENFVDEKERKEVDLSAFKFD